MPSVAEDVNQAGRILPLDMPRVDFCHWAMANIPAGVTELNTGECSRGVTPGGKRNPPGPAGTRQGLNDYTGFMAGHPEMGGKYFGYDGPCPPWNDERLHHYRFTVLALDVPELELPEAFTAADVQAVLQAAGAGVDFESQPGYMPYVLHSRGFRGGPLRLKANQTSQQISALLMIAPYARQDTTLEIEGELVSRSYIDITGQVCADSIGTYQYSGVGGQMDFIRGSSLSEGGKPIIALPSRTNKGISRIVATLKPGAGVVTTRAHVHYVVTEYGIAYLFGKNLRQRARALINIAHPDDRDLRAAPGGAPAPPGQSGEEADDHARRGHRPRARDRRRRRREVSRAVRRARPVPARDERALPGARR